MKRILIQNARLVNEGQIVPGSVLIEGERIADVLPGNLRPDGSDREVIDAGGGLLFPGIIDAHVHFREPGLTHKADMVSESRAAAAGGVTSIMDMPNTDPQTTTLEALEAKLEALSRRSLVNYSCYFGATHDNYVDFERLDSRRVCGIKLFMGSSTGNMLVNRPDSLRRIFAGTDKLIAAHCEDQTVIGKNLEALSRNCADGYLPLSFHTRIRSVEACYQSSQKAVQLAQEAGARLHLLHISTARELELLSDAPLADKRITAEVCVPHLLFCSDDYLLYGPRIKCNPAVKDASDRDALRRALNTGRLDVMATDHAPHLLSEKRGGTLNAASGIPMIQFSLLAMLKLAEQGVFPVERIAEKMCHAPAELYHIKERGYLRPGYKADLVLVKQTDDRKVTAEDVISKCGWSPLENHTFRHRIDKTFVNGRLVYDNGQIDAGARGQELQFE